MNDPEVLRTRLDGNASKIPREGQRRSRGGAPAAPALWCARETQDFPAPDPPLVMQRVYGITTGAGYRIRAFTIFERSSQLEAFPA